MSIQAEIERITSAKQSLSEWLANHDVRVSINAKLNELVELLDTASSGKIEVTTQVLVTITSGVNALILKTVLPDGTVERPSTTLGGAMYICPANSLIVLYGNCSGGSTLQQAYPTVTVTEGMTVDTIYYTGSNLSSERPIGIFVVHVGTKGGTITFSRTTTKNSVV